MTKEERNEVFANIALKLKSALGELEELKKEIDGDPSTLYSGVTMRQVYDEMKRLRPRTQTRLRELMCNWEIETVNELLQLKPEEVIKGRNIGKKTVATLETALKNLGIVWRMD